METISSELRLRRALLSRLPAAATTITQLKEGTEVLVFREDAKQIRRTGPYKIVKTENKQVFIIRNGKVVQHSISQGKPFLGDELIESL